MSTDMERDGSVNSLMLSEALINRLVGTTAGEYGFHDWDYNREFIAGFETALDVLKQQLLGEVRERSSTP